MALTVNSAFEEFNKDYVNLDPERTKIARSSRDWLINQLISLPAKIDDFPTLYDGMHIKYGSFARNTKIRPLDDIDLMLTLNANGSTYSIQTYGKRYVLSVPENAINLRKLCNDDNTLNSIKVVNKLVSALHEIEHYKNAEKHRRQEAATLSLNSYEWNYDIVPALYTDTGYYLIPDGNGEWKASDPRIDLKFAETVNSKHGGKIHQIIRTLKYWNTNANMPTIPSYLYEIIILNYFNNQNAISNYIDFTIRDFWGYLHSNIYNAIQDPKGFQGDLNTLSFDERNRISSKANEAYNSANEAVQLETTDKDQRKSINKWREIFGDNFPTYG